MATTDHSYHWYLKRDTTGLKIGVINDEGDPVDSGLTLKVYYTKLPDEILTIDDEFPIPDGFRLQFLKGVIYEIAQSYDKISITIDRLNKEYENAKQTYRAKATRDMKLPKVIKPLDMGYEN